MERTKLTVQVPHDLLENVERYAAENNTTLTDLIEAYLYRIPVQPSWKRNIAAKPTKMVNLSTLSIDCAILKT